MTEQVAGGSAGDAVAVVICCRNRAALLAEALPAVRAELRAGDELVVVDSASSGDDVRHVALEAGAKVIRCELPGLARARNAGWGATDLTTILFTDDDCRPLPGWRDAAAAALGAPGVGAVWGDVVADRESGIELSVGTSELSELTDGSDLMQAGHGACMAFRREALDALGGFDEQLGAGGRFPAGEDKDAFWRAWRAGWRVCAAPGMALTHVVHRDEAESRRVMFAYGIGAGVITRKRVQLGDSQQHLMRDELWRHGLLPAARWIRRGRFSAASGALARSGGVLQGWWQVRRWPVVSGHLVPTVSPGARPR